MSILLLSCPSPCLSLSILFSHNQACYNLSAYFSASALSTWRFFSRSHLFPGKERNRWIKKIRKKISLLNKINWFKLRNMKKLWQPCMDINARLIDLECTNAWPAITSTSPSPSTIFFSSCRKGNKNQIWEVVRFCWKLKNMPLKCEDAK